MPYAATALIRQGSSWKAEDVELDDVEDLDGAADLLRDLAVGSEPALLFVEEDDEYFAVLRVDGDEDPRLFISDRRATETSELAGRLFDDAVPVEDGSDEPTDDESSDDDEDSPRADVEPGGDPGILADLGTGSTAMLDLCAEERMLPADVIFAICEKAGCSDALDEVRGAV